MSRPLRVLQSFRTPRPTTNPYIVMLRRSLRQEPDVDVLDFDWRVALTGRYDVFHAHWPEILVSGRRPVGKLAHQAMFLLLLARLRVTRTPLVRTQHNLELPSGISRRELMLLRVADRMTTLRILLTDRTPVTDATARVVIPHGEYVDWFAPYARSERVRGRILMFGLVRRYKGTQALTAAFAGTGSDALSLRIAGKPSDEHLAAELDAAAAADARVSLRLQFLDDTELVAEVSAADLVVLPYPKMHNSGAVLAALSLQRPVLVPDNAVNRDLRDEVGPGWVHLFDGPIAAGDLEAAARAVRDDPPTSPPELGRRSWDGAGAAHLRAYERAATIVGRRR